MSMAMLVRLRIAMADTPGALASVAAMIARFGGNIVSIDVQRAGVVSAVDDIVVDLPEHTDISKLRNELVASGSASLLSHQLAQPADPIVSLLRRATEALTDPEVDPEAELIRSVADLCQSPAVWVTQLSEAARYDAGRYALERAGAIALRSTRLPEEFTEHLPTEAWMLAVPDPNMAASSRVVFVARHLSNEFTNTEIARIEALMAFHAQLERLLAHY